MTDDEARELVLLAAENLYYSKGYAAVGMDELRSTAGVSLRRLYRLFATKNDIVEAVLARKHDEWEAGVAASVAAAGARPKAQLLAIYDFLDTWFCAGSFRGCAFINAFGELGATHPEVAKVVREHKASFQHFVAELVCQLGGPELLGDQLAILAEGAQVTAAISGDPKAARAARSAAETLIAVAMKE